MTAVLRTATSDDAEILHDTIVQAFEEYRDKFDPPSSVFKETVDSVRSKVETGGGFIAILNDTVAGCVLYQPYETHMYLGRLAVLPVYRGCGVARMLVDAVEKQAHQLDLLRVELAVRISLTGNHAMFKTLGYRISGEGKHEGYDEVTYLHFEKWL